MGRGGVREGAGRPKGKGPHGEATKPMRIPLSMIDKVKELLAMNKVQEKLAVGEKE